MSASNITLSACTTALRLCAGSMKWQPLWWYMPKFIEHHCIAWNESGWRRPAGKKNTAHPKTIGWAHEEWNNSPDRLVNGWRAFHTQANSQSVRQVWPNRLALIMTAYHPKLHKHYLVGAACDVEYANHDKSFKRKLSLFSAWRDAWRSTHIRAKYGNSRQRFLRVWRKEYHSVAWKAPKNLYWWNDRPVAIHARELTTVSGRQLTWRYGSSQPLRFSVRLERTLKRAGCTEPLLKWFSDDAANFATRRRHTWSGSTNGLPTSSNASNRPSEKAFFRYMRRNEIEILPRHTTLQKSVEAWLRRNGYRDFEADRQFLDLRCRHPRRGYFLIEVKPCSDADEARYAVRHAVGQLYEYRLANIDKYLNPNLLVVLGAETHKETLKLLVWAGIWAAWPRTKNSFHLQEPRQS